MKKSKSMEIVKPEQGKQALQIYMHPGETESEAHARSMLSPVTNAAVSVMNFHPISGGCEVNATVAEIARQTTRVQGGDMSGPEAMLVAQAHALDIMFSSLAQRAALNSKARSSTNAHKHGARSEAWGSERRQVLALLADHAVAISLAVESKVD